MKFTSTLLIAFSLSASVCFAEDAPAAPAAGEKPKRDMDAMFKKLDADGNGSISLDEFKAGGMGKKDPAKAEEFFKKKDKDANGSLSLEEFKTPGHAKKN